MHSADDLETYALRCALGCSRRSLSARGAAGVCNFAGQRRRKLSGGGILRACSAHAFSLIEILCAIAVVVILAGLILPSVTRGLEKARNAECAANLRTLHAGLSLYAQDYGGSYPAPTNNPLPGRTGVGSWAMVLVVGNYIGVSDVRSGVRNPFLCPNAMDTYAPQGIAKRTYTMNTLSHTNDAVSPQSFTKPSQTIILADGTQGNNEGDAIFFFRSSSIERVEPRHENRFGALFVDGHVEMLDRSASSTFTYLDNLLEQEPVR